jgi:hypothetical protein
MTKELEKLRKRIDEFDKENIRLKWLCDHHYKSFISIRELYNKEIRKNDLPEIRMIHAKNAKRID